MVLCGRLHWNLSGKQVLVYGSALSLRVYWKLCHKIMRVICLSVHDALREKVIQSFIRFLVETYVSTVGLMVAPASFLKFPLNLVDLSSM